MQLSIVSKRRSSMRSTAKRGNARIRGTATRRRSIILTLSAKRRQEAKRPVKMTNVTRAAAVAANPLIDAKALQLMDLIAIAPTIVMRPSK